MKKQIKNSAIIFVALIAFNCSTEKFENDWTKDNLRGKVKSFTEVSYKVVSRFGNIEKGERERQFFYFDIQKIYNENGNVIEENKYKSDGRLAFKYTYHYDEKGNRVEKNRYGSDGKLYWRETFEYEYDSRGNWVKRIDFEDDKPKYILVREYEYFK